MFLLLHLPVAQLVVHLFRDLKVPDWFPDPAVCMSKCPEPKGQYMVVNVFRSKI